MGKKITKEDVKNLDYQIKVNELVKEALFLRQYGTKEKTDDDSAFEDVSEIQK